MERIEIHELAIQLVEPRTALRIGKRRVRCPGQILIELRLKSLQLHRALFFREIRIQIAEGLVVTGIRVLVRAVERVELIVVHVQLAANAGIAEERRLVDKTLVVYIGVCIGACGRVV